ncbi:efflux RND transporter permease subunit [Leptospira sp. 201903071]|nr:efflux RND transporter permease subunit [Leptospira ainazelensis]
MLIISVLLFGIISVFKLNYSLLPTVKNPALSIVVEFPGADSETVENTITIPLEDKISAIGGITEIRSQSEKGKSLIRLDFESSADLNLKTLEIKERIENTVVNFPKEVRKPRVLNFDPNEMPIFVISLKVPKSEEMGELRAFADSVIKKSFEGIEGVSKVTISGGKVKEILISFDIQKLNTYNISLAEIYNAIHFNNRSLTLAAVEEKGGLYQVRLKGKFKTIEELIELPVTSLALGKTISLGNIATVEGSYRDDDNSYRVNGSENIGIYVYKKHNANILQISAEIDKSISNLNGSVLRLDKIFNQADNIKGSYANFFFIMVVTFFLIYIFLKTRKYHNPLSLIALLLFQSVLILLIFSFVHFLFKIDFDLLTVLSFYLSFIIWITLYFQLNSQEAKMKRTLLLWILLSLPSLFLPSILLNPTIAINLIRLSLLTALGISCLQLSFEYITARKEKNTSLMQDIQTLPEGPLYQMNSRHPDQKNGWRFLIFIAAVTIFALVIFLRSTKEVYFNIEDDRVYGYIELPSDSSFLYTNNIVQNIEAKLLKNSNVKDVISQIDPGHAFLIINYHKTAFFKNDIIASLNESVGKQNPAYCYFTKESELGRMKEVSLDIIGSNHADLNKSVPKIANLLTSFSGIQEVILNFKPPRSELQLDLNSHNPLVQNSEIGSFLRTVIQGSVVSKFNEENSELDIRIRASKEYRGSEKQLNKFLIKNNVGQFSPISNLFTGRETTSPIKLFRKNKRPTLALSVRAGSYNAAELLKLVHNNARDLLNKDERIEFNSRIEKLSESNGIFLTYLLLIFSICFFLFTGFTESIGKSLNYFFSLIFTYSIFLSLYLLLFKAYDIGLHIGSVVVLIVLMIHIVSKSDATVPARIRAEKEKHLMIGTILYLPLLVFSNIELTVIKNVAGIFLISAFLSRFLLFEFNVSYMNVLNYTKEKITSRFQILMNRRK